MTRLTVFLVCFLFPFLGLSAKEYELYSLNKMIKLQIQENKGLHISIQHEGTELLKPSLVDISIDGKNMIEEARVRKVVRNASQQVVRPVIPIKSEVIEDKYNELTLKFNNRMSITFRAYDNGIAYRFSSDLKKGKVRVDKEILDLAIPDSSQGFLMQEKDFLSMSESPYICQQINTYKDGALFSLPALFQVKNKFIEILESDVVDFPGLWLVKNGQSFQSEHPQKALETKAGPCYYEQYVTKRASYIAETTGNRNYPWRIFAIADQEKELITNQLVYLLATPAVEDDYSWIQPGLATLDWWGRRNIYGTDFTGGVNTETHKYFVDFNSRYGLKYFVLDDGWSDACDLKKVNENLDLNELSRYAQERQVGLVFWVHAYALKQDVSGYLDFLQSVGAKGIKVDFFNRDDQDAVNLFHQIASEALKRKIVIDFHGICKPIGLNRTYPNVMTSEGLIEFEMNGVSDWANPQHHTLLPFIRMVAGPMDYLPGTLNNAQKKEFYQYGDRPVGLGSRAHSIALSVLYESPITMLPDSPSDYLQEDECTSFLTKIPTVWDETKVIDAQIGKYVIIARRKDNTWFIAAITNWDNRKLQVKLDFLPIGNYQIEAITDGINTKNRAIDYKKVKIDVDNQTVIPMSLEQGGGWVGIITKKH